MFNIRVLKIGFTICSLVFFSACDKDNTTNELTFLTGEWLRSDANEDFSYTLKFDDDFSGLRTVIENNDDGTSLSSATPYSWSNDELIIKIEYNNGTTVSSSFSVNEVDQLLLPALTEIPFDRQ